MATDSVGRIRITPYSSIPSSLNETTAVFIQNMKNVEVFMRITADTPMTGFVYLLKWVPESTTGVSGGWYPYRNPVALDTSINNGKLHAAWNQDIDTPAWFQLLVPAGVTVAEALIQGIRY